MSSPVDQDGLRTNKLVSDMDNITIKEESSSNHDNNLLWKDGSPSNYSPTKQASVGSLSYSVTNATSSNQTHELNTKGVSSSADNSLQKLSEQKKPVKKPTARAKVPFEKGYSQMDWLKLTRTHPDLAGSLLKYLQLVFWLFLEIF